MPKMRSFAVQAWESHYNKFNIWRDVVLYGWQYASAQIEIRSVWQSIVIIYGMDM